MRLVVVLFLLAIVGSLAYAATGLVKRDAGSSDRLLKALTIRIVLSVTLFVLLFVAWKLGLIEPHGLSG